jgi:hypothetical protein
MENEYKLGLIGAIIFTIFALLFYLGLKRSLTESSIFALLFSLVATLLINKKVGKK